MDGSAHRHAQPSVLSPLQAGWRQRGTAKAALGQGGRGINRPEAAHGEGKVLAQPGFAACIAHPALRTCSLHQPFPQEGKQLTPSLSSESSCKLLPPKNLDSNPRTPPKALSMKPSSGQLKGALHAEAMAMMPRTPPKNDVPVKNQVLLFTAL